MADPGAGNAGRSSVLSTSIPLLAKKPQARKRITERAAPKKKDSLERPTAVAVIIVIARSAGNYFGPR